MQYVKREKEEIFMDVPTLERHALAAPGKPLSLKDALLEVSDFRIDRRKRYPLYEILMVAVCAMVAGATGPTCSVVELHTGSVVYDVLAYDAYGRTVTSTSATVVFKNGGTTVFVR